MQEQSSETETKRHVPRITQRGGYNAELENWLTNSASMMGERSNFAGLVASIERGGSGGCRGTKGVGMVRYDPFEHWGSIIALNRAFDRAERCDIAWRQLIHYDQWLLAARYCYSREKLPHGMHGQLGDLSAVAFVCAHVFDDAWLDEHKYDDPEDVQRLPSQVVKLIAGAGRRGGLKWAEDQAATELQLAHSHWIERRSEVDQAMGGRNLTRWQERPKWTEDVEDVESIVQDNTLDVIHTGQVAYR